MIFIVSFLISLISVQSFQHIIHHNRSSHIHHGIHANVLAGSSAGCKFTTPYVTNSQVQFRMCTGQAPQDLKNGMTIINLIGSRGYLPTCRIMQLMLWMASVVSPHEILLTDSFFDVGANIGSCSVHMASLGFPVVLAEPVKEHIETIKGSAEINPSFNMEINFIGISSNEKTIHANFVHGGRNWGASAFNEVSESEKEFETTLQLRTLDQIAGHRRASLLKVDCEGCEWEALKGGRRLLKRVPMIKIELVQPEYTAGNETVKAEQIVTYLHEMGFDLFMDLWNEQHLYFGRHGDVVMEIDKMFGSAKFNLSPDVDLLHSCAKRILESEIDPKTFNQKKFLQSATDVIAIERGLSQKMKKRWIQGIIANEE